MMSIKSIITDDIEMLTEDLVNKWNSVAPILRDKYISDTKDIGGAVAFKYKHDFIGLLLYLDIPKELHYPHMVVNGIKSSYDYKGDVNIINILNFSEAGNYYELFTN